METACLKFLVLANATTDIGFGLWNLMPVSHALTTFLISNYISLDNDFALPINFYMFFQTLYESFLFEQFVHCFQGYFLLLVPHLMVHLI